MEIRMVQTRRGAEDGITVRTYTAGEVYDLAGDLPRIFLEQGWAETLHPALASIAETPQGKATMESAEAPAIPDEREPETKNQGAAPENKTAPPAKPPTSSASRTRR